MLSLPLLDLLYDSVTVSTINRSNNKPTMLIITVSVLSFILTTTAYYNNSAIDSTLLLLIYTEHSEAPILTASIHCI